MQVRALERGFCGRLIEAGEIFEIEPDQLGPWMEEVEAEAKPKAKAKAKADAEATPADDLA